MKKILLLLPLVFLFSCSDSNGSSSYTPRTMERNSVQFNEIKIANADYKDEFGNNPGWVEFYNPYDTVINLKDFSLTDNADVPLWTFGDVQIQPHSYFIVFFSGKNISSPDMTNRDTDLIRGSYDWSWADNQSSPPGGSTAQSTFSESTGLTGKLVIVNNPLLGWSSAVVMLDLNKKSIADANLILLSGYVSKDSRLEMRLAQDGLNDWESWSTVITGTGQQNDLYTVDIPQGTDFPDLSKIYGLRFSNNGNNYGTVDFSFNSIIARKQGGNFHTSFELRNNGGKLFLLDPQGQLKDSIAYPAGIKDLSYAKKDEKWVFSKPPTPGFENSDETYAGQAQPPAANSIPASGHYASALTFTLPANIYCERTGKFPTETGAMQPGSTHTLTQTTIMRCVQYVSGAYPSSPVMRTYIFGRLPDLPIVSIAVDPFDMFDNTYGLYKAGPNASPEEPHFGANYHSDKELPVHLDFFENGANHKWSYPAGIRIMGNWSRMNPKKSVVLTFREGYGQKNLKYPLFPEYPHLTKFKHFVLRNNGNNYPNDYIRDMLMTSLTEGLGIDYQKGRAAIVYYNGEYYGIHNLRERSNSDYYETNYGIDEDYIDLVKAGGEVSKGSDADYKDILRWLEEATLTNDNMKKLEERIDVDNFTNHYQSRIFYNDRDWPGNNMKMWRRNSPPSKWKFFMYDTDHGFGSYGTYTCQNIGMLALVIDPNRASCDKAGWPNPLQSTLILRKLLENPDYKNAFINRFSLLLATYFAPARVNARIDVLMAAIQTEIPHDQNRWGAKADGLGLSSIRNFGNSRPAIMQTEIQQFFGLSTPQNLTLSVSGNGKILVHNLPMLGTTATIKVYPAVPITLKAQGASFKKWSDGVTAAERTITAGQISELVAEF